MASYGNEQTKTLTHTHIHTHEWNKETKNGMENEIQYKICHRKMMRRAFDCFMGTTHISS